MFIYTDGDQKYNECLLKRHKKSISVLMVLYTNDVMVNLIINIFYCRLFCFVLDL